MLTVRNSSKARTSKSTPRREPTQSPSKTSLVTTPARYSLHNPRPITTIYSYTTLTSLSPPYLLPLICRLCAKLWTSMEQPPVKLCFWFFHVENLQTSWNGWATWELDKNLLSSTRFSPTSSSISLSIQVVFTGDPKPTLTWFINNQEVKAGGDISITTDDKTSVLTIHNFNPEKHVGEIICKAENEAGEVSCTANMTTYTSDMFSESESEAQIEEVSIKSVQHVK